MRSKRADEIRNLYVDFSRKLRAGELLTGTPTVEEIVSTDLTIENPVVMADIPPTPAEFNAAEQLVYKSVQFTVTGGVAGTSYVLRITATTDATYPQTLIEDIVLRVN
jgi:hypothetical protein